MRIEKCGYSNKPWRLLTSGGYEVRMPISFEHPMLGWTRINESVSGNTRKECETCALSLLEQLLLTPNADTHAKIDA